MSSNRMTTTGARLLSLFVSGSVVALGAAAVACSVSTTPILTFPDSGFFDDGGGFGDDGSGGDAGSTPDAKVAETGTMDTGTPDTAPPPCDPSGANCVLCGTTHCAAPMECCGSSSTLACLPSGSCGDASVEYACNGPQSCTGGNVCCVNLTSAQSSTSNATASCQGAASCSISSGSTGTAAIITSVACSSSNDCGNVVDQYGVPQATCCKSPGYSVGVCLSDTYAGVVQGYGGSCN
jgi:hypothetical protein